MRRVARPSPIGYLALAVLVAAISLAPDVQAQARTGTSRGKDAAKERVERRSPRRSTSDVRPERRAARRSTDAEERRRPEPEREADARRGRTHRSDPPKAAEKNLRSGTQREQTTRTSGERRRIERRPNERIIEQREHAEQREHTERRERNERRERTGRREYRDDHGERRPAYRPEYRRETHRHHPDVRVRPFVRVDVEWPWEHRHRRGWAPRYRYRQVVSFEAGWGGRHRDARIDVRTDYRHRVRSADHRRAVVDIFIDRIALYEDGYFLGAVDRIPERLRRIRAVIHRNGRVDFDRDVFLVGDPYAGFELIATRHYEGFLLDDYRRGHDLQVGVLDLRRGRVEPVRHSRLFDPYDFDGFVPISLLPEDDGRLCDYGYGSVTAHYYGDDDDYYYGRGDRGYRIDGTAQPLRHRGERTLRTSIGADIRLKREIEIERIE